MERRMSSGTITLENRGKSGSAIVGYAAVFQKAGDKSTLYQLRPGLFERIAPTAFNRALAERQDVRGLFNHDPNQLLARVGAGTLKLSVDATGLRYEITPPATMTGHDVFENVRTGNLAGSSFAFLVTQETYSEDKSGTVYRTIEDVDLFDVGPVTYPAYTASTTGLE